MLYMRDLFTVVASFGGLYFLVTNRQFDYFSLAFFSALVYFLPGFFGSTSYHIAGVWSDTLIHPEAYLIMVFVLLSIWLFAFVTSYLPKVLKVKIALPTESGVSMLLLISTAVGFAALLASSGGILLQPEKAMVMESLGRWHILFYTAATIGLPVAFHRREYLLVGLFLAFLGFDLFVGFRSALAISIISASLVLLYSKGKQRLLFSNWKIVILLLAFGVFIFGYKMFAFAVKAGLWDVVWSQLQESDTYLFVITHSEPFVVQQTLNEVITNRFHTNADHIYSSLYQILLFSPELGVEKITFNSLFQPALFSDVEYGLAANIWAQMWSAGGWPLVIFFTLIFNVVLAIGNITLHARSMVLKAGLAPAFCYWAFYIHRNDLGYALNLEKRHLLLLLFVIVIASVIKLATRPLLMSSK